MAGRQERGARFEEFTGLTVVQALLFVLPGLAVICAALGLAVQFLDPLPPRRIVIASGPENDSLHALGLRYAQALAEDGIDVEVRTTRGAGENIDLLSRPEEKVEAAFLFAGVAPRDRAARIVNVSNLYHVPLWCLLRGSPDVTKIADLKGRRIAVGAPGSGLSAWLSPLLALNGLTPDNTALLHLTSDEAMSALAAGEVDAMFLADGEHPEQFDRALGLPGVHLMTFSRAESYARRFPHIVRLSLPPGTLDFERNIPDHELSLIGTTVMIAARADVHPTVVDLLVDAARQIHTAQGIFEKRGEFPNLTAVDDIPVSEQAVLYAREGPSLLRRYLPLWAADALQRLIILAVPLIAVLVPLVRFMPGLLDIISRHQMYRWYADLRRVERRLRNLKPGGSVEDLLRELDRIEESVAAVKESVLRAGELYTLRVHLGVVRQSVRGRTEARGVPQ